MSVFFFDHNKTNTICKHLTDNGHWQSNLQVISLANIFDDIEQNAEKVELYYALCQLWTTDDILPCEDLVAILNTETSKKIIANTTSKKYIPEIYIPETALKKSCRLFACPKLAEKLLFFTAPLVYQGSKYDNLQDVIAVTDDGRQIELIEDCSIHDLVDIDDPTAEQVKLLLTKLKSYEAYTAISHSTGTYTYKNGTEVLYDAQHSKLESSVRFEISGLLKDFETSQKRYYIVVKDAGQGKTTFLCDFCDTVLFKRNIPTIFINVNQITDSLLAYFKRIVSDLIKKDYLSSIELLKQYLSIVDRQLIVVIDGLNESTKGVAFKNEVLEFIRHIDNLGFVKMIATTRHAAYDLYYKSFKNESFGSKIVVDIERVYGMGERKSASFKYKILKKYREHFKVGCYISKMAQKKLSNDTLLLRIFCEVFEGDSTAVVNDIFLYKLFKAYIEKRSSQLLALGKIKRIDDLMSLLEKIAKQMLSTDNLDNFSARGFSPDEKDLLDTVVEEDILIKSVENKENPFFNHTLYSFTYDEFRDFLLAMVLLGETDDIFARKASELSTNYSRYDGLLKYLFLFCKNTGSSKLSALESTDNYNRLYSANIFSVDDSVLLDEDVRVITRALETNHEALYYEICKRLNLTEYGDIDNYKDTIERIVNFGIVVNLHMIMRNDLISRYTAFLRNPPDWLNKVNAIIFLNYKPADGKIELCLNKTPNDILTEFFDSVANFKMCGVGFDTCSVSFVSNYLEVDSSLYDYCEAARKSAYINERLIVYPCSFYTAQGTNLKEKTLRDIWSSSPSFESHRANAVSTCNRCKHFIKCHYGCIIYDINNCGQCKNETFSTK